MVVRAGAIELSGIVLSCPEDLRKAEEKIVRMSSSDSHPTETDFYQQSVS